jgi:sulfate/thiosulfate transport system ATP-binding protein
MSITASGVCKRFGSAVALEDVSLDVPDRSLTALLGPSGGGKSTLLRVLAGLETPDAGTVRIAGADVTGVPARERGIGFVFQHYAAFRHLTVAENVAFGLTVRRRPKREIRARVEELLALVRLEGLGRRYPSQLSGGQRQRMVLARALAVEPRVLLLDEPFGALDASIRAELRDWLRRLHAQIPVTTIVVTHDQDEALELADQIVVVNAGRVEQAGTPANLYDRPATPFVMSFLGTSTRLAGSWYRPHDIELRPAAPGEGPVGTISRVTTLPTHVRVDVDVPDEADPVVVHLPRAEAAPAEVSPGRRVRLLPRGASPFPVGAGS